MRQLMLATGIAVALAACGGSTPPEGAATAPSQAAGSWSSGHDSACACASSNTPMILPTQVLVIERRELSIKRFQ